MLLPIAKVWAYPLWFFAMRAPAADDIIEDIDWWVECIDSDELRPLDRYSRFAFMAGALNEFRTVLHYRLRSSPLPLRFLLKFLYPEPAHLAIDAESIGPGFFIQHGHGSLIGPKTMGRHCWVNQQVTIGYNARKQRPVIGDNVRVGPGAIIVGPITLHDGATVGPNATVIGDVGPGETVVTPPAVQFTRRREVVVEPDAEPK